MLSSRSRRPITAHVDRPYASGRRREVAAGPTTDAIGRGTVLVMRSRGGCGPQRAFAHRETALEVLDRRYAQGEIDENEYRERRAVLGPQERG